MTGREKWAKFLAGGDVGPMVSPICDKWSVGDMPYAWKGPEAEPSGPEGCSQNLCGQIMMAKAFGWDPLFYAAIQFKPQDERLHVHTSIVDNGSCVITTQTINTPYGDLTRVDEDNGTTRRCAKEFLDSEEDYAKMLWYTIKIQDFDMADAVAQGKSMRRAIGGAGMLGTWVEPCVFLVGIQALFYHCMDYPEAFQRLYAARQELQRRQLEAYREAGFDFLYYIIPGTEWISPAFFREWMQQEAQRNIARWRSLGGFTVWHTCGREKAFLEQGIYNEMMPEIFETLSEPPVGNLPSLAWGRERLDPRIASKGNVPLDILLQGSPEDVREAVRRVKRETAGYRHILAMSDCVLNGTPAGNLRAFVEEGRVG